VGSENWLKTIDARFLQERDARNESAEIWEREEMLNGVYVISVLYSLEQ
jgi:hypothetical protein